MSRKLRNKRPSKDASKANEGKGVDYLFEELDHERNGNDPSFETVPQTEAQRRGFRGHLNKPIAMAFYRQKLEWKRRKFRKTQKEKLDALMARCFPGEKKDPPKQN